MYTKGNLAVRKEAKKESDKLGSVPINKEVKVLDSSQDYFRIQYEDLEGYVYGDYLTESKEEAEQAEKDAIAEAKRSASSGGSSGGGSSQKSSSKKSSSKSSKKSKKSSKKSKKECLNGGVLN